MSVLPPDFAQVSRSEYVYRNRWRCCINHGVSFLHVTLYTTPFPHGYATIINTLAACPNLHNKYILFDSSPDHPLPRPELSQFSQHVGEDDGRHYMIIFPHEPPQPAPKLKMCFVPIRIRVEDSDSDIKVLMACGPDVIMFRPRPVLWVPKTKTRDDGVVVVTSNGARLTATVIPHFLRYDAYILPEALYVSRSGATKEYVTRVLACVTIQEAWRRCFLCKEYRVCKKWIQSHSLCDSDE